MFGTSTAGKALSMPKHTRPWIPAMGDVPGGAEQSPLIHQALLGSFPCPLGGSGTKTIGSALPVPGGSREGAAVPACRVEPRLGHVLLALQVPARGWGDQGSSPQLCGTSPAGNDLPLPAQGGGKGRAPFPQKAL